MNKLKRAKQMCNKQQTIKQTKLLQITGGSDGDDQTRLCTAVLSLEMPIARNTSNVS